MEQHERKDAKGFDTAESDLGKAHLIPPSRALQPHVERRLESSLLDDLREIPVRMGGPSLKIQAIQDEILKAIQVHPHLSEARKSDSTFLTFSRKMTTVTTEFLDWNAQTISRNSTLRSAFVEFLDTNYSILTDAGIAPSTIKKHGHKRTLWEVGQIIQDIQSDFLNDPTTKGIHKTALTQVLEGRYQSVKKAKERYVELYADSKEQFGGNEETKNLVKTAATAVFTNTYPTISDAKERYLNILNDVRREFGEDPHSKTVIRSASLYVFQKKYRSVEEAKKAFDNIHHEVCNEFKNQIESSRLIRTLVGIRFKGRYKTTNAMKKAFETAQKESQNAFGTDPQLKRYQRTAAVLLTCKVFPSIDAIKKDCITALQKGEPWPWKNQRA